MDLFTGADFEFERMALTMEQIEEHQPPPNPAKLTDTRAGAYSARFGGESWELDALEPATFRELITDRIDGIREVDSWEVAQVRRNTAKTGLEELAEAWND